MPSPGDAPDEGFDFAKAFQQRIQDAAKFANRIYQELANPKPKVAPEDRLVTEKWIPVWESLNVLAKYDSLEEAEDAIRTWESRPNPPRPFIGIIHIHPDSTLEWVDYEP